MGGEQRALQEINNLISYLKSNYTINGTMVKESEVNSTKNAIQSI